MKRSNRIDKVADILLWVLPLLLIIPNVALCFTEQSYNMLDCIINVALPLGLYMLLCAASANIGRTSLFFIPLMVLCAFQIVLLFLYGESIIAIDMFLNVATTNVGEATELLGNLLSAVFTVCLLYLPPITTAIILIANKGRSGVCSRKAVAFVGVVVTFLGGILLIVALSSARPYIVQRKLFPVNVISNMFEAAERTSMTKAYKDNSSSFKSDAHSLRNTLSPEAYVLVIGETSRAANWQLDGYERETNPRLSHRDGLIYFSKALSESNTTHKSVPLILSHLSASSFGDSIYRSKSVFDAFDEAGFATAWISNQQRNHSLIDFFGEQSQNSIFIKDDGQAHYDEEIHPVLEKFLLDSDAPKKFVVLHTYGSHFNYRDRYDESQRHFAPDDYIDAAKETRDKLINAYDNTIRYTDNVLDSIIATVESMHIPAAVVYLSDHGEDIFDDERDRFLHASPTPTAMQLHVPMFIWLSEEYRSEYPDKYSAVVTNAGKNVSTSRSAFHTLMSLADVVSSVYDSKAALSDYGYAEPNRVFLNDYDEAVPIKESGLRKFDLDYLSRSRISY